MLTVIISARHGPVSVAGGSERSDFSGLWICSAEERRLSATRPVIRGRLLSVSRYGSSAVDT